MLTTNTVQAVVTFSWEKYQKVNGRGIFITCEDVFHAEGVDDILTLLGSTLSTEGVVVRPLSNFALPWGEIYDRMHSAELPDLWVGARFEDLHVL